MTKTTAAAAATPTVWIKHFKNDFGSRARVIRNAYAFAVAMEITGGRVECPSCAGPMPIDGTAEVDRIFGNERDDNGSEIYREGTIVYLCMGCNQGRSRLQSEGLDWRNVEAYQALVINASRNVSVPRECEAREWWSNRPTTVRRESRFA